VKDQRAIAETEMRTSQHAESGHGHGSAMVVPTVGPLPSDDDARFSSVPDGVSGQAGDVTVTGRGESNAVPPTGEKGHQNGPGGDDADADAPLAADVEDGGTEREKDSPYLSTRPTPNISQKPPSSSKVNRAPVTPTPRHATPRPPHQI